MQQTTQHEGITFAVDDVAPATTLLPECRTHEAVKDMLDTPIESCSDYHGSIIKDVRYQPLLAAVYTAFSQHRPLVLSPDAVWMTIAQGVAHHMVIHGERLRSRFVAHEGKLDLVFQCNNWVEGSPENPWPEAFASWAGQIRDHVGYDVHDALICDFSTTGPVERAASQIVIMDVFERYFHYVVMCICGIPSITLEGTSADWQRLADKAAALSPFDLDWWLEHLLPICEQFVRASRGDVDLEHWQGICKLREEYGGDIINGWIAKLFPYLRGFAHGPCNRRNPIFATGEGFTTFDAPSGLSRVPFAWRDALGHERKMEAVGGLVGVKQDSETMALRPEVGWAVRDAEKMDVLLKRLVTEHRTFPGVGFDEESSWPPDLCKFFSATNGADLFVQGATAHFRVEPTNDCERLDWGEVSNSLRDNDTPNGHIWYRLVRLGDGTCLAINPSPVYPEAWRLRYCEDPGASTWDSFSAICHCDSKTQGKPGQNPVIALSFTELLERMLESGGRHYWCEADFVGYGDAEEFTRRK